MSARLRKLTAHLKWFDVTIVSEYVIWVRAIVCVLFVDIKVVLVSHAIKLFNLFMRRNLVDMRRVYGHFNVVHEELNKMVKNCWIVLTFVHVFFISFLSLFLFRVFSTKTYISVLHSLSHFVCFSSCAVISLIDHIIFFLFLTLSIVKWYFLLVL